MLANEAVAVLIIEAHFEVGQWLRVNVLYLHTHFTASYLTAKDGCLLQGIDDAVGVDTALKAKLASVLSPWRRALLRIHVGWK